MLSRSAPTAPAAAGVRVLGWDGASLADQWVGALDGADAVLNLAGRTVNCRYNERNKREIYASRLDSTRVLGEAIAAVSSPPRVWLNSSTATIYRHSEDRAMDEASGEVGSGFSVDVATKWEAQLAAAQTPSGVRKVALRTALVMGSERGGPFAMLRRLARLGLGGAAGNGRQMVSWIHMTDWLRAVEFLLERMNLDGAVNVAAPEPLPNEAFMRELRRAAGMPVGLRQPRWLLEVGAVLLRTETELVLKSRWVVPARLQDAGFTFTYPSWPEAVAALIQQRAKAAP